MQNPNQLWTRTLFIADFTSTFEILNSYLQNKEVASRPFQKYQICLDKTTGSRLKN